MSLRLCVQVVLRGEGETLAKMHDMAYFECSAKDNLSVDAVSAMRRMWRGGRAREWSRVCPWGCARTLSRVAGGGGVAKLVRFLAPSPSLLCVCFVRPSPRATPPLTIPTHCRRLWRSRGQ